MKILILPFLLIGLWFCNGQEIPTIPTQKGKKIMSMEYYFDLDTGPKDRFAIDFADGTDLEDVTLSPSTSQLKPGPHMLYLRLQDEDGEWGHPSKYPFFVFPKLQATHLNWEIKENQILISSGQQPVDPGVPHYLATIESPSMSGASESKEIMLRASLTFNDSIPFGWVEYSFAVRIVPPKLDVDTDGDGIMDRAETGTGIYVSPNDTGTDPELADTDGDSIPDGEEVGSPLNPNVDDTALIKFFEQRTQALNLPAPTIIRNDEGEYEMRLIMESSQDLTEWFQLIFNDETVSTEDGEIVVQLPVGNQAIQFFQLLISP